MRGPLRILPIDVGYLGIPGAALAFLVEGPSGHVLVETGCAAGFGLLRSGLADHGVAPGDLAGAFVTHVHLDHAGSAGHLAAAGVAVHVHPRGARHLVDPTRLIAGSRAVHGSRYDLHYGDPLPIAAELVHPVPDREAVELAGLRFEAVETPGHARHHHAWLVGRVGGAPEGLFTGDALAMISPGSEFISIPTPPSDLDVPAWSGSVARLRALPRPLRAFLTHGGERPLGPHLDRFVERMDEELPLLGILAPLARADPAAADARYRDFLLPRARAAGVREDLAHALLGRAFRSMNLAGVVQAVEAGRFATSVG